MGSNGLRLSATENSGNGQSNNPQKMKSSKGAGDGLDTLSHIKSWPGTYRERESKAAQETPDTAIWRLQQSRLAIPLDSLRDWPWIRLPGELLLAVYVLLYRIWGYYKKWVAWKFDQQWPFVRSPIQLFSRQIVLPNNWIFMIGLEESMRTMESNGTVGAVLLNLQRCSAGSPIHSCRENFVEVLKKSCWNCKLTFWQIKLYIHCRSTILTTGAALEQKHCYACIYMHTFWYIWVSYGYIRSCVCPAGRPDC